MHENRLLDKIVKQPESVIQKNPSFENYTVSEWKQYMENQTIDYEEILIQDPSLQEKIKELFLDDFMKNKYISSQKGDKHNPF